MTTEDYLRWFGVDAPVLHRVLSEAMGRGAEYADLYFQHMRNTSIGLEDGIINSASTRVDQGVGVRAVIGDQVGYAYCESLDTPSMLRAAQAAATIASGSVAAAPREVSPKGLGADRYKLQRYWDEVNIAERLPILRKAEAMLKGMEPSLEKISVYWSDSDERIMVATSDGALMTDRRPMGTLSVSITALKNGQRQSHGANTAKRMSIDAFDDERIREVCAEAVKRTMILFEARRPPAGEMAVVLAAGASGILLHEAIGHGFEADFNRKGASIYSTLLNQKVAPDFVTVIDDGTQEHDRGALNVDDEGNETEKTVLIEDGVLRSYLHDRISARHYGVKATGSGRRQSFRHVPMPRMRSTYMLGGPHSYDEMIASVERGIVAETFTNGQVLIGGGDFTFYVKNGWLIEGGKITAPIKDVNIIGNGPQALKNVLMAANDPKVDAGGWTCGKNGQGVPVSVGMPSVLVKSMTVGGDNAK